MNHTLNIPKPMVDVSLYRKYHKHINSAPQGVCFEVDSFGDSVCRMAAHECQTDRDVLKKSIDIAKQVKAEPEKKYYIETITLGDGVFWRIHDIQSDGSFIYNEHFSNRFLMNATPYWIRQIAAQAIFA